MKTFVLLALLATAAHADELNLRTMADGATPNRVFVSTGAEYGFVAGLGYTRIVPVLDRHIAVSGDVTLPWAGFDLSDYRVRARALVPIVRAKHFQLAGAVASSLRGNRSPIATMTDVGLDASLVGGFYARRWFVALEGGADFALSTHITHSDGYRMDSYPDAKDGWYSDPGANIRGGVQAGLAFDRYDVTLRVGQVRDSTGEAPLLPFYGTLSVAAGW